MSGRRGSRLAALAVRNFRLFLGGQLVSSIGTWLHQIAEVWLTFEVTGSGLAVGIVVAARFVPVLTIGLWGGAIADRRDKRTTLYVTQSVRAVAALALGVLALADHATAPMIIALALVGGAANAIDNPVRRAFISDLVDPGLIFNAVSLNSTVMATSRVTGPLIAGAMIATVGVGWCFIVNGVSYVAVLVALRAMRLDRRPVPTARGTDSGSVADGIRYAAAHRAIWVPLAMVGLVSASAWNWETLLVLHATDTFDGGARLFTAMFAVLSVGTLVGAMANASRTDVDQRLLSGTAALVGVAMLAMAFAPGIPLTVMLLITCGIGAAMFNTASNTLLQLTARGDYHGRVMSLFSAMFVGTKGIGGALAGALAGSWGPRVGIAVGGCGCLAAVATGRAFGSHDAPTQIYEPTAPSAIGSEP